MPDVVTLSTFTLSAGAVLADVPVAVGRWGTLNQEGTNAIVVCHALTGDTNAADWWGPLIGPGRAFDTDRFCVFCLGVPGSPYGSISPLTTDPATGDAYGPGLPLFTIRDVVRLHRQVLEELGVRRVAFAVGGSMGGMQALEWGFHRDFVGGIVPVAVGAWHSAWCIGWSEAQRQAVYADPRWQEGRYDPADPPRAGLAAARMMAMVSYRSRPSFEARFGRVRMDTAEGEFSVESYLRYQGDKLVDRFDAACYVYLTRLMDTHDVARGRAGSAAEALGAMQQPALVIGVDSDVLYPLAEQRFLAEHLPNAQLAVINSPHGHDAFLIEFESLTRHLKPWIEHTLLADPIAA